MLDLLSLLSVKDKLGLAALLLLALAVTAGSAAWAGYSHGYETALDKGHADLLAEQLNRAEEAVDRALLVARLEAQARTRLERAMEHATQLEGKLDAAEKARVAERSDLTRRIDEISARARVDCRGLYAEWVLEYNLALAGAGGEPLPGNAGAGLAAGPGRGVPRAVPRVSSRSPLTDPADVLAHARDYGAQCRRYAQQVQGWQETDRAWKAQAQAGEGK